MKRVFLVVALLLSLPWAGFGQRVSLSGDGWTFRTINEHHARPVTVPYCWPVHSAYRDYTGTALFQHDFVAPLVPKDSVVRLRFDGVFYRADVWLNGVRLGEHEGGYTPFEFDVTSILRAGKNVLVVEVNNNWSLDTIPGLATAGPAYNTASDIPEQPAVSGSVEHATVYGWWNYGGINRDVLLLVTRPVYIENVKIASTVNLKKRSAEIQAAIFLHNASAKLVRVPVTGEVAGLRVNLRPVEVPSDRTKVVFWRAHKDHVHLWDWRDPFLYESSFRVPGDQHDAAFGVRDLKIADNQLLLNGRPIHLFGANRDSEDPVYGLIEPTSVIQRDLGDMLAANMRMMRIAHYPQAQTLLDYADRHGMLIIAEAGNWDMSGWQMANEHTRALWKKQMREMVEEDWNHPSIIAWSMGNEFESATPAGIDWMRDMRKFTRTLDTTRWITFASRFTWDARVHNGDEEASRYSDFVCVNLYGKYGERLDRTHVLWPYKPIFVTEFGRMGEPGLADPKRIAEIETAVAAMKARPYVVGGSLWIYADYRSRFPGTPPDGLRPWGVVTFNRKHRESYDVVQKLFAPEPVESKEPR